MTEELLRAWEKKSGDRQKLYKNYLHRADKNTVLKAIPELNDEAYSKIDCLSCGNCFECDGCFAACPEDAIIKLGKGNRYNFNYDACTGCAVCYEQCPCHAIEMIPEPVNSNTDAKK